MAWETTFLWVSFCFLPNLCYLAICLIEDYTFLLYLIYFRTVIVGNRTPSIEGRGRDSSRDQEAAKRAAAPAVKEMSEAEMEKKAKSILDEFLHLNDIKVSVTYLVHCVSFIRVPSHQGKQGK
jgi:hypothetical protein